MPDTMDLLINIKETKMKTLPRHDEIMMSEMLQMASEEISTICTDLVEIPDTATQALLSNSNNDMTLDSVYTNMEAPLRNLILQMSEEQVDDEGNLIESQESIDMRIQCAIDSAIMAADPSALIRQRIQPVTSSEELHVINSDIGGASRTEVLSSECFTNAVTENMVEHSCQFGLNSTAPDEFVRNVAPLILLNPSDAGMRCTATILYVQDQVQHSTSGMPTNWQRHSLVAAMRDSSILSNRGNKLVPVVRDENSSYEPSIENFVPDAAIGHTTEGDVTTGYLLTGRTIDVLGISQTDSSLTQGKKNEASSIAIGGGIESVAINLDPENGKKWLRIDVSNYSGAKFSKAGQGADSRMVLNMRTKTVLLHKDTKLINGTTLSALIPELDTANNGGKNYKVYMELAFSADLDVGSSDLTVTGTTWRVSAIYDDAGEVSMTAGDGKAIVDALVGTEDPKGACRIQGYQPDLYPTNRELSEFGQQIGKVSYSELLYVPIMEPIVCRREVGSKNDTEVVDNLVRALHVGMNNAAVDLLINFSGVLKDHQDNGVPGIVPDYLGVSRFVVNPTLVSEDVVDVQATVQGMRSAERSEDVSAVVTNKIITSIFKMFHDSGMNSVLTSMGRSGEKQRIVVAVGSDLAPYVYTPGDTRFLGDLFDIKVVYSDNKDMKGRAFAFPSNPVVNNKPDCLRFAHTAYSPEAVFNLNIPNSGGGTVNVLGVFPRYRMAVCNPVMVSLEFTNIQEAYEPVGG
jgi:hypothetical protein